MKRAINSGKKRRSTINAYFPSQKKRASSLSKDVNSEEKNVADLTTKANEEAEQWGRRLKAKPRYLTDDGKSWYILAKHWKRTPSTKAFAQEWNLHPAQRHQLRVFGRTVLEKRWSQSWGFSYAYSGATNRARPLSESTVLPSLIPTINSMLLDVNDKSNANDDSKKEINSHQEELSPYNGCLQNWYTPDDTIGLHADDEKSLRTEFPIFSLSWGGPRRFLFRPKVRSKSKPSHTGGGKNPKHSNDKQNEVIELWIEDGDLLIMGGTCQETHKHEIPKLRKTMDPPTSNRINWTVRAFS